MTDKNEAYDAALDDYAQTKLDYAFRDIHEELDDIEDTLESEASKMLLHWIRDAIERVHETYKP